MPEAAVVVYTPVVSNVAAMQFVASEDLSSSNGKDLADWCNGTLESVYSSATGLFDTTLIVDATKSLVAKPGDWVIKPFDESGYLVLSADAFAAGYVPGDPE